MARAEVPARPRACVGYICRYAGATCRYTHTHTHIRVRAHIVAAQCSERNKKGEGGVYREVHAPSLDGMQAYTICINVWMKKAACLRIKYQCDAFAVVSSFCRLNQVTLLIVCSMSAGGTRSPLTGEGESSTGRYLRTLISIR